MGSNPPDDSQALEVRLLGDVRVERNGERLPGFDSPRLQRLLAYLSLSDGQNRAHLAFELWPNST
ncbi:MAG TPA: SARP family transcriptional regulator, partial [Actinomycetota bacterium]|nr:SARP family transcriptional regulator [Actinomycetota bacterium]